MTPNAEIRLTSVIHGLRDVIFPAIDPDQSLANEQSGLILAQLGMLLKQLPWITRYHALCRDDLRETAAGIAREPAGGAATNAAAAELAARLDDPPEADPLADYRRIGFAVEALTYAVANDGEPGYRSRVDASVLAYGKRQVRRERIWFRDAGFDPRPEELPEIAAMFADGSS